MLRSQFYNRSPTEVDIPIDFPLGFLVVAVFMHRSEKSLFLSNHSLLDHVAHWHKYVDDILSLIEEFVQFLNNWYPSIQFTGGNGWPNY